MYLKNSKELIKNKIKRTEFYFLFHLNIIFDDKVYGEVRNSQCKLVSSYRH